MGTPVEDAPECSHIWNSALIRPSRVIDCDWCSKCGDPRPGYLDPREKWKHVDEQVQ